uniref:Uncharacterized protein n=1 Tax=Clytia hemisphaerica TaxID=252671 RepID=A0A7M6DJC7_9CNID
FVDFLFYSVKSLNFFFFSSDVWRKILRKNKFAKFEEIFHQKPNIVNSLRGLSGYTLLMWAVWNDRFDIFVHLMEYPQVFSLVNDAGQNVLHWVSLKGTVRHLENKQSKC